MHIHSEKWAPALTVRSCLAAIFCMVVTAALINYVHVMLAAHSPGEHALVIPGLWVFGIILALCGVVHRCFKIRLLSRPELMCVLYIMLLSAPMMSQGFWHRVVSISSTIPRTGDFARSDAFSTKFWPAGENLLRATGFQPSPQVELTGTFRHEVRDHTARDGEEIVVLENHDKGARSSIRFSIPVKTDEVANGVMPGTPYLVSVLLRPRELAGESHYFVNLLADDDDSFNELVFSRSIRSPSVIHPQGFQREGVYGVVVPDARERVILEVGLAGEGVLHVADPQFISVLALEQIYTGRQVVSRDVYEALPVHARHGLIVKPDRWLSFAGLTYLLTGHIPWSAWWRPLVAWGGFLGLVMSGTLSLAVLMRRKWVDSERFALPLTRIPLMLIGEPGEPDRGYATPIWRNRMMWIGFVAGLVWCLLRIFSFYNPAIPDPTIEVDLAPYFGPEWGRTWEITFTVMALFVSIAIFVELNILISAVIGFLMFRLLFWYGYVSGMDATQGFPFDHEQQIGAYVAYAACMLIFSRKYFREVLKEAVTRQTPDRGEIFSYRTALLLLAGVFAGSAWWAGWIGLSVSGLLLFMGFLLLIGFVAMRIRAECGVPYGYFTPTNLAPVMLLAGGIPVFGPDLVVFTFVASFFVTVANFMMIPGTQLEVMELGRRYGVRPRHILGLCLIAMVGGLLIGGWSFLSMSYAVGGNTMQYDWPYIPKNYYLRPLYQELIQVSRLAEESAAVTATEEGIAPSTYGYLYGAGVTALLAIGRQLFAGFWFHPIGFILGTTLHMGMGWISVWGSILTAWFIRLLVVKIGGAETVRTKLLPFFAGVFLAAVTATLFNAVHATWLRAQGVELIFWKLL